ncbi:MAG: MG2 domain-containing protein [Candidatus Hodarchaeales archaeon]|jgi:hypothetical protein
MKKKLISIFLLLVLNFGIFYAHGMSQTNSITTKEENVKLDDTQSFFDVEREILQIYGEESTAPLPAFRPGPLNANNVSAAFSLSSKVQEEPLTINIDLEKQVISPGSTLRYIIQTSRGIEPAPGETLILDIIEGEYWGWYYYWLDDSSTYNDRLIISHPITTDSNGEYQGAFTPSASGRYSIIIRSPNTKYIQESRSFTVADIGLFWRVSNEFIEGEPHYSVAYVLNSTDFSPVAGADISLTGVTYDYNSQTSKYDVQSVHLFSGVSNEQGVVEIEFVPPSSLSSNYNFMANLSATFNGESVFVSRNIYRGGYYWGWNGEYSQYEPYEFIITTDKPVYTPGETIQARILLWENDYLKVTKEPIQTSFVLKFLSPSQHVLLHQQVSTNSYGVTTYSFPLDLDSELGTYDIITQKDETVSSLEIRVDKYEKPSFRVSVGLDREYVAPGNLISGNVTAEYYFGKPVARSKVEIAIGYLKVLTDVTDENGYLEFSYRLPGEDFLKDMNAIPINVTVTDTVGREVTGSSVVQITDQIYVWAYVNPWYPKLDENITIYFGAYQYSDGGWWWRNWTPLPKASVKIQLFGITIGGITLPIETLYSETDNNGQGEIIYQIPSSFLISYSRFKGVVEVNVGDGRKGTSSFYFSVDRNSVDIDFDQDSYNPGDEIKFEITVRNLIRNTPIKGNVRIRIFDPDYDVIRQANKEIPSQGSVMSFKLSPYAPKGKYVMYVYLETTYDSEYGSWTYYRYSKTVYFYVGSNYQLTISADKVKYSLTESITLTGTVQGQTNAPVMVQFVKKGIVFTEYIDLTSSLAFNLEVEDIGFLAPRFWVFAFAILNDGTILESSLDIEIDSSLLVEFQADQSQYEPGETAKISIKVFDSNHQPISTVLAVSFIDSSVFGVEPDPESEKDHFDDPEYWPSVWTVVSWKSRQRDWWFWWYDDYFYGGISPRGGYFAEDGMVLDMQYAMAPEASNTKTAAGTEPSAKKGQDIRDNLPENAFWNPIIIVEEGSFDMELILPDTIGEWTVRVVATTHWGQGKLEKFSFKTFIPFFVEIDKEPFVLQDDVFLLKGVVYNYLDEIVVITLELETESGILLLGRKVQQIRLPSGFLGSIGWACLAQDVGKFNVTLYAATTLDDGTNFGDALRKPVEVIPNGITSDFKSSGFVSSNSNFSYLRYTETVQQTEFIELSLGLGEIALSSWERLIGYPYGCTEQTISRLIPTALVLQYLSETGQLDNDTEELIRDMIVSGLSRLYSQRHSDGGWGWWHSDSSRAYMTSLVLHGLGIVNQSGVYVDPTIITDALEMLELHQNNDGSWTPDSWRGVDQTSFTAFVLRSIIPWKDLYDLSGSITEAISYITTAWNDDTKRSTYLAGLYLNSVPGSGFGSSSFKATLLTYLKEKVQYASGGNNYWTYATEYNKWWRALGGDVEITALALQALAKNDYLESVSLIRGAVQWLLQRQSWYGWGNTADTVAAISSIITLSRIESSSNEDAEITLKINGDVIGNYNLSVSSQPTIYIDLDELFVLGSNSIELMKQGSGDVSYYFYGKQVLRSLPTISFPSELSSAPGEEVSVQISLMPTSSLIFASNMSITPLDGEITPIVNLPLRISHLTQKTYVNFNYSAPTEAGSYQIPGFEITYRLSNADLTHFSPGIISRHYGPIELEVSNTAKKINSPKLLPQKTPLLPNVKKQNFKVMGTAGLELIRTYSQTGKFQKGDLVQVSLTITNTEQVQNFLMLEDIVPVGFELDESTIQHPAESFEITTTGITFFFPELGLGNIEVKYGIMAMNVRQSLVSPAKLSSMYDSWIVESSSAVLGDTRIPIDPKSGKVIQDLQIPVLQSLSLQESLSGSQPVLDIAISVSDNWGIASVRVFIKQFSWKVFETLKQNDNWQVKAMGLSDGSSEFYLEVIDLAGNVLITEPLSEFIELEDLFIPILPIIGLLSVAIITGAASSLYLRKKHP